MRKSRVLAAAATTFVTAGLTVALTPGTALAGTTWCTGALSAGSYQRLVVPQGAVCTFDPSSGPIEVKNGVRIHRGGSLVLGDEGNAVPTATIHDGVKADHPAQFQIHFSTITGGVEVRGGSGPFGGSEGIFFSTIEDNDIRGGVDIHGYNGFWFGFIRNDVRGNVNLSHNVSTQDPDSNEYVTNTIRGNLSCSDNDPAPQIGDSEGEEN